jgi:hypothetical protein
MIFIFAFLFLAASLGGESFKELEGQFEYIRETFLTHSNVMHAITRLDRDKYSRTGIITNIPQDLTGKLTKFYNTIQGIKSSDRQDALWAWTARLSSTRLQRLVFNSWNALDLASLLDCLIKKDQSYTIFKRSMEKALSVARSIHQTNRNRNLSLLINDMDATLINLNNKYIQYLQEHDEY